MAKKKGKMTKRPSILVPLPGCAGCGKHCKYNGSVADPFMAANYNSESYYGCNSRFYGFEAQEGE